MICKNCNAEYGDGYKECPVCHTPQESVKGGRLLPARMYVFAAVSVVIVVSYVFCFAMGLINFRDLDYYYSVGEDDGVTYTTPETTESKVYLTAENPPYEENITRPDYAEDQEDITFAPEQTTEEQTETTTEEPTTKTTTQTTTESTTKQTTTKQTTTKPTTTKPTTTEETTEEHGNLEPVQKK